MNIFRFLTRQKRKLYSFANRQNLPEAIDQKDVFLVSHPRAGATWLSFILACLLFPNDQKKITLKNLRSYVPDINYLYFGVKLGRIEKILPKTNKNPRVIFVHAKYNSHFPKVIYLVRNPIDSLVSYWHLRRHLEPNYPLSLSQFIRKRKVWPENWEAHVNSWLRVNHRKNFKLVKYEDLSKSPEKTVKEILDFIGVKKTQKQVKNAISLSSFARMKKLQKSYGVAGIDSKNSSFVRKGKIGSGKKELTKKDVEYIRKRYKKTMKKLNYLD